MKPSFRPFSFISDIFQTLITGVKQDHIFRDIGRYVGPLPGDGNGPFDAARHVARAALLYSQHPRFLKADWIIDFLLSGREAFASDTNSDMDFHNNEVGKKIGSHLRANGGSRGDAYAFTAEAIKKSLGDPFNIDEWKRDSKGMLHCPKDTVTLSNGLQIPTIVIMPKEEWLEVTRDPATGKITSIEPKASS